MGLEGEFELFMRFLGTPFHLSNDMHCRIPRALDINITAFTVRPSAKTAQVQMLLYLTIMYLMLIGEQTKVRPICGKVPTRQDGLRRWGDNQRIGEG